MKDGGKMRGMGDILLLESVEIMLGSRLLVPRLDVAIRPGELLTVMGPSGSGKSTLLAFLGGFLDPAFSARGHIRLGGTLMDDLPPHKRGIGILFQDDLLFPHMSVGDNLAFGLAEDVSGGSARLAAVEDALERAGLAGFGHRDPATLSGGQRARISLMRALLAKPRALLLDEPFSRLDKALRIEFRAFVFEHLKELGLPGILVTHDSEDAAAAGGDIILICDET